MVVDFGLYLYIEYVYVGITALLFFNKPLVFLDVSRLQVCTRHQLQK